MFNLLKMKIHRPVFPNKTADQQKVHFQIVNCMTYCLMVSLIRFYFDWKQENPILEHISIALLQQITATLNIFFSFPLVLQMLYILLFISLFFFPFIQYTFRLFISAYYLWIFIYTGSYCCRVHFAFFYIKLHLTKKKTKTKQYENRNDDKKRIMAHDKYSTI